MDTVYVVSASRYQGTNKIAVGKDPIKVAQSNDRPVHLRAQQRRQYDLDHRRTGGDGSGNGRPASPNDPPRSPIDIAQDTNFSDTSTNTQSTTSGFSTPTAR